MTTAEQIKRGRLYSNRVARATEHLEWILRHPGSAQREERGCNGDASLLLGHIAADIRNLCGIQAD